MEDLEVPLQLVVDVQDGSDVTTAVAVVRRRPYRHKVRVLEPILEAIHDKLMGTSHKLQVVNMVELGGHFGAEKPAGTTRRDCPGVNVFRIRPHQVTERSLVRNFHATVNEANLVKGLNLRRETTMDAEDLALNDGTDTKIIENLGAVFPRVDVAILAHGLLIETVDASNTTRLVVTTEKSDAIRVLEL